MAKMFQLYGIGQGVFSVLPPPVPFENAPTSNQTNYEIGQLVYTPPRAPTAFYIYGGGGNWIEITDVDGPVQSVTGTANQILATPTTGDVVLSLIGPYTPATYTAHGVLIGQGSSSIVATSAGTAGQVLVSGGASADPVWTTATFPSTAGATGTILRSDGTNWVASTDTYPDTVVAGDILIATAANVVGSLADVATGQVLMSGGVGVVPSYSGSPSVSGSLTAATTITATLGDVTATNGNFVLGTTGKGISFLNTATLLGSAAAVTGTAPSGVDWKFNLSDDAGVGLFALNNSSLAQKFSVSSLGQVDSASSITAATGDITATAGNFVSSASGNGIFLTSPSASGAAASPVVVNGRSGRATFTSVSIAAGADLTLTLTNSSITASTTIVLMTMSGATSGAALCIKSITNSAGSSAIVVTNGAGATTSTADIQIDFVVVNA